MKKIYFLCVMCIATLTLQAQRNAILDFDDNKTQTSNSNLNEDYEILSQFVTENPSKQSPAKKRASVEVLYGYLKVFPNELGEFQSEPKSVINKINEQAQHGYNNWRIPTKDELALLKASGYLSSDSYNYMSTDKLRGIVLLVSDGDDYQTIKSKEKAENDRKAAVQRAEADRNAAAQRARQEHVTALEARGYVDLGLSSGTLWKETNESGFYTYNQAFSTFGYNLPTSQQMKELGSECRWIWTGSGYKVIGPNGKYIFLPASGAINCGGELHFVGVCGYYWSSSSYGSEKATYLYFDSGQVFRNDDHRCNSGSIRLVQK